MSSFFRIQLFVAFWLLILLTQVIGHSYVTSPTSRSNQRQSNAGCRGPSCMGPCDVPLARKTRVSETVVRGSTITVQWPRNNHAGGFIRFAWAPTSQSDNHAAFDAHVQQINCHEVGGCRPDNANEPNGGDSGPGDGSSRACSSTIQVPLDLTDGEWTLQWAWFGGAFSLGDYYSCIDYRVAGGPSGSLTPVFIGGDFSYPNQQKCKFFNTDKLHQCRNEPCEAPLYPAAQQQSGPPAIGQLGVSITIPTSIPLPTVSPVPIPSVTSTTGRTATPVPSTTGQAVSPPSPVTPSPSPVTPSPVTPSPVSPSGGNCANTRLVSASQAVVTVAETWNHQLHAIIEIRVAPTEILSDWVLEITWPTSTHVLSTFNAGQLQCEGTLTSYLRPAASWANNLSAGSVASVEVIATNTDLRDSNSILANTRVRVLKM